MHAIPGRTGRNELQHALGDLQLGRLECGQERIEGTLLLRRTRGFRGNPAIAAHRIDVVLAAENGRGRLHLIAVMHEERHEHLFQCRHRRAFLNRRLAEARESGSAHIHHADQLGARVGPVRPPVHARVRIHVLVGHVPDVLLPGGVEDRGERGLLIGAGREVLVAVGDRDLVPCADAHVVHLRDVERAVGLEGHERVRIVHHGDASRVGVVVVVAKAEGVADLVSRELTHARERPLAGLG